MVLTPFQVQTKETGGIDWANSFMGGSKQVEAGLESIGKTQAYDVIARYNTALGESPTAMANFYTGLTKEEKVMESWLKNLKETTATTGDFDKSQKTAGLSVQATSKSAKAAAFGMNALNMAMNVGVMLAVSLAIQGITWALDKLILTNKEAIEGANELNTAFQDSQKETTSNISTLQSLDNEFNNLSKGVDAYGNNLSLTTDEYARYKEIVAQVLDISPSLISGYDAEGNALANKNGLLEKAIELQKQKQKQDLLEQTNSENSKTVAEGALAEYDEIQKKLSTMQKKLPSLMLGSLGTMQQTEFFGELIGVPFDKAESQTKYMEDNIANIARNAEKIIDASLTPGKYNNLIPKEKIEQFRTFSRDYISEYDNLVQYAKGYNQQLQLVAQATTGYDSLSDASKTFVSEYINGFEITDDMTADMLVKNNDSVRKIVNGITTNDKAKIAIDDLVSLETNKSSIPAAEWKAAVEKQVSTVASELDLDPEQVEVSLGVKADVDDIDNITKALEDFGKTNTSFTKDIWKDLPYEELQQLHKIIIAIGEAGDSSEVSMADFTAGLKDTGNSSEYLNGISEQLGIIQDATEEATDAFAGLDEILSADDKDSKYKKLVEYLSTAEELIKNGEIGSDKLNAITNAIFGEDADSKTAEEWQKKIDDMQKWANDSGNAYYDIMDKVSQVASESNNSIVEVTKDAQGNQIFNVKDLDAFIEKMGGTESVVDAMFGKLQMYSSDGFFYNVTEEALAFRKSLDTIQEGIKNTTTDSDECQTAIKDIFGQAGLDATPEVLKQWTDGISGFLTDGMSSLDLFKEKVAGVKEGLVSMSESNGVTTINVPDVDSLAEQLGRDPEVIQTVLNQLDKLDNTEVTYTIDAEVKTPKVASNDEVIGNLEKQWKEYSAKPKELEVKVNGADSATTAISGVKKAGIDLEKQSPFKVEIQTTKTEITKKKTFFQTVGQMVKSAFAKGTSKAPAGKALVGEKGRELVFSKGTGYIVGSNGAEIVDLKAGDVVVPNESTEKVLSGEMPAFSGKATTYEDKSSDVYATFTPPPKSSGSSSSSSSSAKSSTASSSAAKSSASSAASSSEDAWKDSFDKAYARLEYLRNLDKIDNIKYYKELTALNNKYFKGKEKYLTEYRQHEVELYELQKTMSANYIKNLEHKISLLENADGNEQKIIAYHKQIQDKLHAQAQAARKLGMKEDNEFLISLSDQWWSEQKEIKSIVDEITDNIVSMYDELISRNDDFELWDSSSLSKLDILQKKLNEINKLYKDGLIPDAERYKELSQDSALDIYNKKKDDLEQIVDLTEDLIKQEAEDQTDALNDQIDAYKEIIDLKKEALDTDKDENDYQKDVADKIKEIAKIQSQMDQLGLDDSREASAEKASLAEQLADLQEELASAQADFSYDAQTTALDDEYDAFEETKQDEIDVVEDTVSSTAKLYELAMDRIENSGSELYQQLLEKQNAPLVQKCA